MTATKHVAVLLAIALSHPICRCEANVVSSAALRRDVEQDGDDCLNALQVGNMRTGHSQQMHSHDLGKQFPIRDRPWPELLEPGFEYAKPPGSGCDQNYYSSAGALDTPALDFMRKMPNGTIVWNGFCQAGHELPYAGNICPDAVANRDYNYYAKSLGIPWVDKFGKGDKWYCRNAGFLEPEIAQLRNNFTALRDKAAEICSTTLSDPKYMLDRLTISGGLMQAIAVSSQHNIMKGFAQIRDDLFHGRLPNIPAMIFEVEFFDHDGASMAGAWNCAMGDLGCDLAYCNWAYCLMPDGSPGTMDECEGWDPIHGN